VITGEIEFVGPPVTVVEGAPLTRAEVEQLAIDAVSAAHLSERLLEEKLNARIETEHALFTQEEHLIVNAGSGIVLALLLWLVLLTTRRG
jgi:hypothetical protein